MDSPIITNLFYLLLYIFCASWSHSYYSVWLVFISFSCFRFFVCLFFHFQFRNIYYLFRAKKSWAIHLPLLLLKFSFIMKMEKLGQKSGLLRSHTQRGKETTCRCGAEVKASHSFYPFSVPYFLGQAVYDAPGLLLWFTLLRQCFLSLIPAQLNPDLS